MKKLLSEGKEQFCNRQFLKFLIIGGINTAGGSVYSYILMKFMQTNIAFICAYVLALTIAFFLNTNFVFYSKANFSQYLRFCVSYVPNFLIQQIIVIILYNILGYSKILVILLSAGIGIPVTFLCVKLFAFRKR
jgi:putative flippase GtrA